MLFSCTSQRPWAQEAPVYGLSGDPGFAEESILNARLLSNRKSNARKSEFRAIDFGRCWAGFRAFDVGGIFTLLADTFVHFSVLFFQWWKWWEFSVFFVRLNNRFHRALKNHLIKPVLRQKKTTGKQHLVYCWLTIVSINGNVLFPVNFFSRYSITYRTLLCIHSRYNTKISSKLLIFAFSSWRYFAINICRSKLFSIGIGGKATMTSTFFWRKKETNAL